MVPWASLISLVAVAGPVTGVYGKVWLTINNHAGNTSSCTATVTRFIQLDMSTVYDMSGMASHLANDGVTTVAEQAGLTVPTGMNSCDDLAKLGALMKYFNDALDTQDSFQSSGTVRRALKDNQSILANTGYYATDLLIGRNLVKRATTESSATMESNATMESGVGWIGLTAVLSKALQTTCIVDEQLGSLSSRCNAVSGVPIPPVGTDGFVVNYFGKNSTTCGRDEAVLVTGQIADGSCYPHQEWMGFPRDSLLSSTGGCQAASCNGSTPSVAFRDEKGGHVASLLDTASSCRVDDSEADNIYWQQVACEAGSKVSVVTEQTKTQRTFEANANGTVSFSGSLGLRLSTSQGLSIGVTVGPLPEVANVLPPKGINTYYHFEAPAAANFTADINFTYTDELLEQLQLNAQNLRWAVFNETTGLWQVKDQSKVDTTTKSVTYTTSSFSEWTVVASSGALMNGPSILMIIAAAFGVVLMAGF